VAAMAALLASSCALSSSLTLLASSPSFTSSARLPSSSRSVSGVGVFVAPAAASSSAVKVCAACFLSFFLFWFVYLLNRKKEKLCVVSCGFRFLISRIIDSCLPCVFDANAFCYCYYYYYYYLSWFFWSWICLLFCLAFFQWIGCME